MTAGARSLVDQAKQWATQYGPYSNGPEGAVLTVPLRARVAWEAGDAGAYSALFTDDGSELIGDVQLRGRAEIEQYLADAFKGAYAGSRISETPVEIRLLTDEVAVAVTEGGVLRKGEETPLPENSFRGQWVVVKRGGDWQLFSHQTSPLGG
ncbi:SgcJ/EcaC family oxidoreductase [Actinacidiphila sp. DG2A-62]|jgi:uncharacterized protein (TIGR02246 family)|uniref:SgcJ/EcaC family oxidoreductase n=1 Tax=Actinacidiphila sp. DG2A-62 TaxID=3108821 RepID=UPI002DB6F051|nr:SgcJ/EcaC family oxidoreductase [Actinacidiphila sp. DG2A-62]MEC3993013.1 SgcJ/EcaC family oxidoreductase [Actinacidiphila sp. DG2A-62]